jgi:lipopolysaccharide assembly protein A
MKWLKRIVVMLLLAMVFFWGILFAAENAKQVALNLVFLELSAQSVSLWLILSFAIGGLLGMTLSLFLMIRLRSSLRQAKRRIALLEKEVEGLKRNSIKER